MEYNSPHIIIEKRAPAREIWAKAAGVKSYNGLCSCLIFAEKAAFQAVLILLYTHIFPIYFYQEQKFLLQYMSRLDWRFSHATDYYPIILLGFFMCHFVEAGRIFGRLMDAIRKGKIRYIHSYFNAKWKRISAFRALHALTLSRQRLETKCRTYSLPVHIF